LTIDVCIIGAGIGGLTLALGLHRAGIGCRVFEAASGIKPLGVGINVLPPASRVLDELGILADLEALAVATGESAFFNRFGQHIHSEPTGRAAGDPWPQLSIHRADLQATLSSAVRRRLGPNAVVTGQRCVGVESTADSVRVDFSHSANGARLQPARAKIAIGCDGIHSALRRQFYPDEGPPRYSGVNMWRGTTRMMPFLSGATMVRAGWLPVGKMVIYPIRNRIDTSGRQLVNWVAEIEQPQRTERDWNRRGRLEDFLPTFEDWRFDWLDVPAMIRSADEIYEFPMVDQDPLPAWSFGRASLLGDAAHPMVPRGSNGAGQAILDAWALAGLLGRDGLSPDALLRYDELRRQATTAVVLMNRSNPPDAILREVHVRTGDRPFERIEDVISRAELRAITDRYKQVAGFASDAR
jgi:5-methylphenazine-1-carboxylate 1-monooxygenase